MNLEDLTKCPICNQKFDIPAVLPCGETVCSKCLSNSELDCKFCDRIHSVSNDEVLVNKILLKNLDMMTISNQKKSNYDLEYEQIKKIYQSPSENIEEFFQPLVDHVVTNCEMKIRQIENIRDDLTQKIYSLKEDILKNLTSNTTDFKSTFEDLSYLIEEMKKVENNMRLNKDDDLLNKYECLRSKYAIKINKFYQIIRNYKQIKFLKSSSLVNEDILGLIVEKSSKILKIKDYKKATFVSNCTKKDTLKIFKNNKKHFIFTHLGKKFRSSDNLDQELVETKFFDVFLHIEVYIKNINIKTKELNLGKECKEYLISNYGGFIYLYLDHSFYRILKKLNSTLEELETVVIKKRLIYFQATKKYLLAFSANSLDIYAHNLVLLMTIHQNSSSLFLEYPEKISNICTNKLYYIFQSENVITVVNQDSGKMIKSFELDTD